MQDKENKDNGAARESQPVAPEPEPVQISVAVEGGEPETAFSVYGATPVSLSVSEIAVYELLLEGPNKLLSSQEVIELIRRSTAQKNPHSLLYRLERVHGCLLLVGGVRMSRVNPPMRQVVHRPYRLSGTGQVFVPFLCHPDNEVPTAHIATEVVATTELVPTNPQTNVRMRSREELGNEIAELDERVDTLLGELKNGQRKRLNCKLDEINEREQKLRDDLEEIEGQREEVESRIMDLDNPNVDCRKQFEIPTEVVVLLDRVDRLRKAYDRYDELAALLEDVVVVRGE